MRKGKILTSPFDLVAEVLEIKVELLDAKSAMGETPNWDSLNHLVIIGEMETHYGMSIPNEEIENYVTMQAIIDAYDRASGNIPLGQRLIEGIKSFLIPKIFRKQISK